MQLNGYLLNVVNKTINEALQCELSVKRNQGLEPFRLFIPYENELVRSYTTLKQNLFSQLWY